MIIKFVANATIDSGYKPNSEEKWEQFCKELESQIEKALEEYDKVTISTAEVIMEEVQ